MDLNDRKCFECWQPGHPASKCPNKNMARILADSGDAGASKPVWLGCVADSGEVLLHRRRTNKFDRAILQRPEPKDCTLGDCMGSVFAKMAALEAAEDAGGVVEEGISARQRVQDLKDLNRLPGGPSGGARTSTSPAAAWAPSTQC